MKNIFFSLLFLLAGSHALAMQPFARAVAMRPRAPHSATTYNVATAGMAALAAKMAHLAMQAGVDPSAASYAISAAVYGWGSTQLQREKREVVAQSRENAQREAERKRGD